MKLPENKKERYQILGLIGVVAVLVLYAVAQIGISPLIVARRKLQTDLEKQQEKIEKAKRELQRATLLKVDYDNLTAEIDKIASANVRRPVLGQYLVGLTETIDTAARETGLKVEEPQDIGMRELPRSKKAATPPAFNAYAVQVSGEGSYARIQAFVDRLERDNPMLCVTDIRILGQQDKPEAHRVLLKIEWPIEAPPEPTKGATP
jgi:Tfp pilus assembly protein PilN